VLPASGATPNQNEGVQHCTGYETDSRKVAPLDGVFNFEQAG
jgi:hypothetical protein